MDVYYGDWENIEDLKKDFGQKIPDDINILFAAYTYECYEGDAIVLFAQNEKLFEVNGGHCSCYGLEDQWVPEETTKESIEKRLHENSYGVFKRYKNQLREVLNKL